MAWVQDFLVVLPVCPPPVSVVPLSARAVLPRGESARESSVPVITAVLIVFFPLPFVAGQLLWFSETVHVEPSLHRLVIRLVASRVTMV